MMVEALCIRLLFLFFLKKIFLYKNFLNAKGNFRSKVYISCKVKTEAKSQAQTLDLHKLGADAYFTIKNC